MDGVTSDLDFKMLKLKKLTPVTVVDSMLYNYCGQYPLMNVRFSDTIYYMIFDGGRATEYYITIDAIDSIDMLINRLLKMRYDDLEILGGAEETLKKLQSDPSLYFDPDLESVLPRTQNIFDNVEARAVEIDTKIMQLRKAKEYSMMNYETVLAKPYECTYSIFNPILKVKQTQTQTFYFNNDLTEVIYSSDIKK